MSAAEQTSNILTSSDRAIRLSYWQITEDVNPKLHPSTYHDSLWKQFEPSLDDEEHTGGNWLIKTKIIIDDSLHIKDVLGFFPLNFVTAYEIYWDGIKIAQNGVVGSNIVEEDAGKFNFSLPLFPDLLKTGEHTLVLRISNHNSYSSWEWFYADFIIGKYDTLLGKLFKLYSQAFFTAGILFIPFLFNLFLYFARKRRTEHLLFGLICFIVILDSTTMLLPSLIEMRSTFIYLQYYIYQIITILFSILFPAFFIYLFSLSKKIIGLVALSELIIFFFFTNIGNVFNIMSIVVLVICSLITLWALYRRREESLIIFLGIVAAWTGYFFNFAFNSLATTMVIATSFSIARQFARTERSEKEAQLKSARLENELLKKNINPHFVLNTLTSIIAWLRKDAGSAIKLIEALAHEFRMINQVSTLKLIPVEQEIDLCRTHLSIMSYRKGAEFKLETIDIDAGDFIPPMIFHTLIENGLTHGYDNKISGTFKLQCVKTSDRIKYILTNDGEFNSADTKGSTGFGAKYIKGRLEESYPDRWIFKSNKTDEGWESEIEIRMS
ncbi:MAG: histidine kinase [Ignavibacteriales bacterium]|nr:MAG: histidine kinase [Ignavibacteriales bacterium]